MDNQQVRQTKLDLLQIPETDNYFVDTDGNTINNKLCNLEVVSQHENVQHAVQNNLYCSGSAWHKARETTKSL